MTSHPSVILRRPHTRTPYTDDPDAIPYRGRFDHATDRTYLTDTPVLDELGRRNGMTHTWLEYRCAYVGCGYVLLVRADHAHDLALRDHSLSNADRAVQRFRDNMAAIGQALTPTLAGEATLVHLTMTGASDD